jgi:hypothetical protein
MGMYSDTMCHGQRDHQASPMERRHSAPGSAQSKGAAESGGRLWVDDLIDLCYNCFIYKYIYILK